MFMEKETSSAPQKSIMTAADLVEGLVNDMERTRI